MFILEKVELIRLVCSLWVFIFNIWLYKTENWELRQNKSGLAGETNDYCAFKGALWGRNFNQKRKFFIDRFSYINKLNKQTNSQCFTLIICGGPCHLSSFKQCSGDFIFQQLVYSVTEKIKYIWVCIFTSLIYFAILKVLSLNFFFKTTKCPFNITIRLLTVQNTQTQTLSNMLYYQWTLQFSHL